MTGWFRFFVGAAVALLVVGLGGYALFHNYKTYLPGLISRIREPAAPNRPVVWEAGPETPAAPAAQRPPNIVFIVADDLGYNDISLHGGVAGGAVRTPNIDSIATDGMRFIAGYSAQATCSPSRAAIMTGRYPTAIGFEFTAAPIAFARTIHEVGLIGPKPTRLLEENFADVPPLDRMGLPPEQVTIAEVLKTRGYRTLHLGKWHLGEAPAMRPTAQGFDETLGFWQGASMFLPPNDPNVVNSKQDFDPIDKFIWANLRYTIREDDGPVFRPKGYLTDYLAEEAAAAITANRNRPFFLYLAFNAPHTPLQALKSDYDALSGIEDHTLRTYGAMIRALDRGVGTVLEALRANGLEDNTLVVFTSDNGGANYVGLTEINRPFRGWKATLFEGGVRVPFLLKWPARLPPGGEASLRAAHFDLFATAVAASGAAFEGPMDGVDLVEAAIGAPSDRKTLFFRSGHYRVAIHDNWKLQLSERPKTAWLFDLSADPTEETNLAAGRPDKVAELTALLDAQDARAGKPLWPPLLEAPVRIDKTLNAPVDDADEYVYWAN